jgi:hypothetical protein
MAEHTTFLFSANSTGHRPDGGLHVGTQGHHIERGVDILYGDPALCLTLRAAGAGCGPGGEGNVYNVAGQNYYGTFTGLINNQAISQGYTNSAGGPVVAFASATWLQNSGNSNYNSLQVSVERRARDLTFLASYAAHSLDDVSAKFDPRDPHRAYGNSSNDLQHNSLSYNWIFRSLTCSVPAGLLQGGTSPVSPASTLVLRLTLG